MKTIYNKSEVEVLIKSGKKLLIAADESLYEGLPSGDWIGGTIPYFMGDDGGLTSKDVLFVTILPEECSINAIKQYDANSLEAITEDYPSNGISFVIIPATSEAHTKFSNEIMTYPALFNSPLVGWISGVHLDDLGSTSPKVFNGRTGDISSSDAIVMHIDLPDGVYAKTDITNLFTQGDGAKIEFDESGFTIENAIINGEKVNFADYLVQNKVNLELPLVADYSGAMINVSVQAIDEEAKKVHLYAPVFEGMEYRIASPVENYESDFSAEISKKQAEPIFSCNCILNYLYAGLEGKKTADIKGPMTFGEIAYMLLNQTMVYVTLEKK